MKGRSSMKGRTITVGGTKYVWRVGRGTTVIRLKETNAHFAKVSNHRLLGVTPDTYARGQWKRTSDGMVTPKHIAESIERIISIRKSDPTYEKEPWL